MKKYFLVFGTMYNKIVIANNEDEVDGKIIKEITEAEAKQHISNITNEFYANY